MPLATSAPRVGVAGVVGGGWSAGMWQAPGLVERTFREESGQILAALIASVGDFAVAEDALQDAVEAALRRWPREGLPRNPAAWLTAIARRRAIDHLRRDATLMRKQAIIQALAELEATPGSEADADEIP